MKNGHVSNVHLADKSHFKKERTDHWSTVMKLLRLILTRLATLVQAKILCALHHSYRKLEDVMFNEDGVIV